jgi:predicted GNAT family acetyltransferase
MHVATEGPTVVALAHYLFHRSTTRLRDVCYLQDLFTAPDQRGRGIGQQLIEAVYAAARAAGSSRVYWQTPAGNTAGRALYDKVAGYAGFIVYARELQCGVGAVTTTPSPGCSGTASHCRPWVVAAQHAGMRTLLGTMRPPSLREHGHGVVVAVCRGVA